MFNLSQMRFTKALLFSVVLTCTAWFSANAQPIQKAPATSPAVLSVDGEDVSLEEFENIFRKSKEFLSSFFCHLLIHYATACVQ